MMMSGEGHSQVEDGQVRLRFVIPEGRSEVTVSEFLSLAFQKSRDSGLTPAWLGEREVMTLRPTKTVSFVFVLRLPVDLLQSMFRMFLSWIPSPAPPSSTSPPVTS